MIATYLKIAVRNFFSNKLFSIIKIGGLAIGLMVCMLILLYTKDEIFAAPFAYWAIHTWLQHFAYRVDIHWWVFGISGGLVLMLALATISAKAIIAARANPVNSLRTE
jgi:putative ABC transport system permease protein